MGCAAGAALVTVLLVLGMATVGATAAGAQEGDGAEGQIIDFELLPAVLTVESGDAITWTSEATRPHTVTDRGGTFDTGEIEPGAQGQVTFEVPGTYQIFCQINPSTMNATVVVEPGDDPPKAARVQAFDENREGESRRFDPATLEVEEGSQLVLANVGGLQHSLAIEGDDDLTTGIVEPGAQEGRFAGDNATIVAPEPGTYDFFCEVFPEEMQGTLVVVAAADQGDTTTTGSPPGDPPGDDAEDPDDPPDDDEAADAPANAVDEPTDGTLVAYAIAALVVGSGVVGLVIGLRGR